jgi:glycosyltransferase involved in cell wall biosynthesis
MEGVHVHRFRYAPQVFEKLAYQGGILAKLRRTRFAYLLVPFFLIGEAIAAVRLIRAKRFDLIHAHWIIPQGWVALTARALAGVKIPVICTSHGGDLYSFQGRIFALLKKAILQRVDNVTVVSRAMKKDLRKLGLKDDSVHVIPMGVDLRQRFVPPDRERNGNRLLFVGRLVEKKGVEYLVRAMPAIVEAHPDVLLNIAGDGPDRHRLEKLGRKLGVSNRISFLGPVNHKNLPKLYQSSDIVFFPSIVAKSGDREGFGLVLVEALGCGCAAVATDLPAMRDIIIPDESALVVAQKSHLDISRKAVRLLSDRNNRIYLGKIGRVRVLRKFDLKVISEKYARLIEDQSTQSMN